MTISQWRKKLQNQKFVRKTYLKLFDEFLEAMEFEHTAEGQRKLTRIRKRAEFVMSFEKKKP